MCGTWGGVAAAYRRSFATLCAGAIPTLLEATAPGGRHLDVGCGTGDLALAAAQAGREVVAVDPDAQMVALTREAVAREGRPVSVREAGAPVVPLPDASCEAVTANFVINHAPAPRASVRDLARVTAPSGRVAMTIWPSAPGPHLAAYAEAARRAGARPVPSTRLAPALDFPRSAEGLAGLAETAGLRVERADEISWTWIITADDLLAGIAGGVAGPGRIHRAQTAAVRAGIEERVRELWSEWSDDDGTGALAFPVTAVLVVARAA
jgi:SAM-dependent methyltransferase